MVVLTPSRLLSLYCRKHRFRTARLWRAFGCSTRSAISPVVGKIMTRDNRLSGLYKMPTHREISRSLVPMTFLPRHGQSRSCRTSPGGPENHDEGNAFPDFVEARVGHGPWRPLVFTDYTKASKLAHWFRLNSEAMITKDTEATLGSLSFRYPAGASFVPFKNTNPDNCTPGPHQTNRGSYELNGADLGG